jgi:hypothetical protein
VSSTFFFLLTPKQKPTGCFFSAKSISAGSTSLSQRRQDKHVDRRQDIKDRKSDVGFLQENITVCSELKSSRQYRFLDASHPYVGINN